MTTMMTEIPEIPLIQDSIPETENDVLRCDVCGVEIQYSGRGRRPTKCDEHKRQKSPGAKRSTVKESSNTKLASDAVLVLAQINDLAALGCLGARLFDTASKISNHAEMFNAQAYQALLTDPALCHTILRGGALSGKALLAMAYGSMLMAVIPTAVAEVKSRRKSDEDFSEDIAA